jgi:hypothetical protein
MHDELDRWIDGALSTYSSAEPLAGLEQRVLDRVGLAEAARRRRWRWTLALAIPAVAAAMFVVLAPKPAPIALVAVEAPPAPVVLPPEPAPVRRKAPKPRRTASKPAPPKRNLFPTLSPLTDEERLLVQLARSSPELLLAKPADEIEIKPIEIAPLQIGGAQ